MAAVPNLQPRAQAPEPPKAPSMPTPEARGIALARELRGFLAGMQTQGGPNGEFVMPPMTIKELAEVWAAARSKSNG